MLNFKDLDCLLERFLWFLKISSQFMNNSKVVISLSNWRMIFANGLLLDRNGFVIRFDGFVKFSSRLITNTKVVIIFSDTWMALCINWLVNSQGFWVVLLCFGNFTRFQTDNTHWMINIGQKVAFFLLNTFQNLDDFFILFQSFFMFPLMFQRCSQICHWCDDHFLFKVGEIPQLLDVFLKLFLGLIKLSKRIICSGNVVLNFDHLKRIRTKLFLSDFQSLVIVWKSLVKVLNVIISYSKLIIFIGNDCTFLSRLSFSDFDNPQC